MRFQLGQQVSITGTAVKNRDLSRTFHEDGPLPTRAGANHTTGVVVGHRTLMEYITETWTEDDMWFGGSLSSSTRPVIGSGRVAWLVAFDMRSSPVLVWDHQIKPLEGD